MPTTNKGFPYPEGSDANDVPADLQALADAVEAWPGIPSLTQAEINALHSGAKTVNLHVYNSTTGKTQRWTGATWIDLVVDNDARLTDARTPTAHAASHAAGAADAVVLAQSQITGLSTALNAKAPTASPTFTGVAAFPDGSAAAPSITNTGDTNTGIAFPADDTVSISTAGVERLRVSSTGLITGSGSLGSWTSWTPSISGSGWSLGNGTAVGDYVQLGKIVHFQIQVTWGTTSTYGAAQLNLSLPVARGLVPDNGACITNGRVFDSSLNTSYLAFGSVSSGGDQVAVFVPQSNGANGQLALCISTQPFTWAADDRVILSGTYEAA